uniref:Uncharacterized protein n=1 Tax=Anguilla anguilla TaxID=7936 RepID=A0A0E9XA51_ANGAN
MPWVIFLCALLPSSAWKKSEVRNLGVIFNTSLNLVQHIGPVLQTQITASPRLNSI